MRISLNSFSYSPNFGAKSKEVRLADDIQRKAKLAFPLFSPTYVAEFYNVCGKNVASQYNDNARRKMPNLWKTIKTARALRQEAVSNRFIEKEIGKEPDDVLVSYLKWNRNNLNYSKIGNCGENSKVALAGLYANGYYNSYIASLVYKASMINKKTGEAVVSQEISMDHALAVTDMNTNGKKTIVLDPWLNFANDKKKTLDIYNSLFESEDTEELEKSCVEAFKRNMDARGIKYNPRDYYLKSGFVFKPNSPSRSCEEKLLAGRQLRENFPELIINKKEDKQ